MNPTELPPAQGATGGLTAPPAQQTDPFAAERAELESLRRYRDEAENVFTTLSPHKNLVEKIIADEKYRERAAHLLDEEGARFYDESRATYEAIRQRQAPQLPPELKPFDAKLDRVISFAEEMEKRNKTFDQQQQQTALQQRINNDAAIVQEMEKTYPFLADDNYAMVQQMALDAQRRQVPFKTVADEFTTRMMRYEFTAKAQANSRPDRTLRSSAGAPGVPGPSTQKQDESKPFYTTALEAIQAAKRKAG